VPIDHKRLGWLLLGFIFVFPSHAEDQLLITKNSDHYDYVLSDSTVIGQSPQQTLNKERADRIMRLIRDLHDDDVYYNAHRASYELPSMGPDIIPFLEHALFSHDYQSRHLAASILRGMGEPDEAPSDRLLEVTLDLLGRDGYDPEQYWSLFSPGEAFFYLFKRPDVFERVRGTLMRNLHSSDGQEKFLSAALLAERGETALAPVLVSRLAPHLADNDIPRDGGVAAHALHALGPSALPYLTPYRRSTDPQQAELADLVCTALETGAIPDFEGYMYVGATDNPLLEEPYPGATRWRLEQFPDEAGQYHGLNEKRRTARDYYGPW